MLLFVDTHGDGEGEEDGEEEEEEEEEDEEEEEQEEEEEEEKEQEEDEEEEEEEEAQEEQKEEEKGREAWNAFFVFVDMFLLFIAILGVLLRPILCVKASFWQSRGSFWFILGTWGPCF